MIKCCCTCHYYATGVCPEDGMSDTECEKYNCDRYDQEESKDKIIDQYDDYIFGLRQ